MKRASGLSTAPTARSFASTPWWWTRPVGGRGSPLPCWTSPPRRAAGRGCGRCGWTSLKKMRRPSPSTKRRGLSAAPEMCIRDRGLVCPGLAAGGRPCLERPLRRPLPLLPRRTGTAVQPRLRQGVAAGLPAALAAGPSPGAVGRRSGAGPGRPLWRQDPQGGRDGHRRGDFDDGGRGGDVYKRQA